MRARPFADANVKAVFAGYAPRVRTQLLRMRRLIFEAARAAPEIGPLVETLKWAQPAYLPAKPRIGTTIRIDAVQDDPARVAAFFHCQTTLVETFRALYRTQFAFESNRALIVRTDRPIPEAALKHCFALALTYHARKPAR